MFCTRTNITHILQEKDDEIEMANKPFLVIMFGYSIHLGLVIYFYFSAMKKRSLYYPKAKKIPISLLDFRRNHHIRKLQINLLDLKLHFIFCNLQIYRMFLDQLMNRWFLANYDNLGPELVFNLWWLSFYLESTGEK